MKYNCKMEAFFDLVMVLVGGFVKSGFLFASTFLWPSKSIDVFVGKLWFLACVL